MRGLPLAPGEGLTLTAYTAEPGTPSHDGLKLPASPAGLGPRTGQAILVAAWYAGLTALALAFAYRGRGLGRPPGAVIITGYLAFVSALAITITQARVSPAAAAVPAAVITLAGTILVARPPEPARCPAGRLVAAAIPAARWNAGRLWTLSLALCLIIAACDAAATAGAAVLQRRSPDRSGPDNRFDRWAGTGKIWPWFQPRCVMRRRWPGRRCAARAV